MVNAIMLGAMYILVALGLTLLFGVMHIVNFAHGEMVMLGAFALYYSYVIYDIPYLVSIFISMLIMAVMGIVMERGLFRPLRSNHLSLMMMAVGLSLFLQGVSWAAFGTRDAAVPSAFAGVISLSGIVLSSERLVAIIIGLVLVVALYYFVRSTKLGRAMRTVEQDTEAAALQGVNIDRINLLAFAIASALAAAAGALIAPIFLINPHMGSVPLFKAFVITIVGGMGSIPGTILAGFGLGFIDAFGQTLLGYELTYGATFAILVLTLLVKPTGLFGREISW